MLLEVNLCRGVRIQPAQRPLGLGKVGAAMNRKVPQIPNVIRLAEVIRRTGKSCSCIYSDIQKDLFPRPVSIDARSKGWIEQEVGLWLFERWRERDRLFGKQFSTLPMHFDQLDKMPVVVRLPEVVRRTGKSRSSIYSHIQKRLFPRPVCIGAYAKGWIAEEIDLWILHTIRQRDELFEGLISTSPKHFADIHLAVHDPPPPHDGN